MDPSLFNDLYGTLPQDKKRVKRDRENDIFGTFENDKIDEDLDMFNFTSIDSSIFSEEYKEIENSIVLNQELLHSPSLDSNYYENIDNNINNLEDSNIIYSELQKNITDCQNDLSIVNASITELVNQREQISNEQLESLIQSLNNIMKTLHTLELCIQNELSSKLIPPLYIELFMSAENDIHHLLKQTEIYIEELNHIKNPSHCPELASLIIEKQPFPKSVNQNKPLKDGVVVHLITGACVTYRALSPVVGSILIDFQARSKQQIIVQNNITEINNNKAIFNDLLFPYGTRKRVIRLKFNVDIEVYHQITGQSYMIKLETAPTKPIIVKTNENQWEESEGILLKYESFNNKNQCSWYQFANTLQKRYLLATKQNFSNPLRPLSIEDFNYISRYKLGINELKDDTMISSHQFDNFWQWFGPGIHKIKYQRHLCKLWVNGIICGFVPRSEAELILKDKEPGTFLIRLSERNHGAFTIAYVTIDDYQKKVSHYMISSDDVFGAKKTLPDFLGNESALTYLVVVNSNSSNRYMVVPKDNALAEYYSKRSYSSETEGYDSKLIRPNYSFRKN